MISSDSVEETAPAPIELYREIMSLPLQERFLFVDRLLSEHDFDNVKSFLTLFRGQLIEEMKELNIIAPRHI